MAQGKVQPYDLAGNLSETEFEIKFKKNII